MRNIVVLLSLLSLAGCGDGGSDSEKSKISEMAKPEVVKPEVVKPEVVKPEVVKPEVVKPEVVKPEVVKPEVVKPEVPKDMALTFFNVDMYQNGSANIKYIEMNANNQPYELNIHELNERSMDENYITHKLNYKDINGNLHSENYLIDVNNKLIIKTDNSILYENGTYKTFNYSDKYINFDFNLEKGQENNKTFNVTTFDSDLHQIVTLPIKVTTKYIGLDKIEVGDIFYNTGKFETIEDTKHSKTITTTWFDITNGAIVKQTKIINDINNTTIKNTLNIVDSSISFNNFYNKEAFDKFNLDFMNSYQVSEDNINLYIGKNNPIIISLINNNIKISSYNDIDFENDSVVSKTIESHSDDGVLSSFISKIQYSRVECEFNCSRPMINTLYLLGVRNNFDSSKNYDSEYAGVYNWYRDEDGFISDNYYIVMDLKAKTCQISSREKLNAYECVNLDVDIDNGQIVAVVVNKKTGTYGSLFANINGKNNEYITGVVRDKNLNDTSIDTFIIKKR